LPSTQNSCPLVPTRSLPLNGSIAERCYSVKASLNGSCAVRFGGTSRSICRLGGGRTATLQLATSLSSPGFKVVAKRWVVERTFGSLIVEPSSPSFEGLRSTHPKPRSHDSGRFHHRPHQAPRLNQGFISRFLDHFVQVICGQLLSSPERLPGR
jgi:hypothetical protein